MLTTNPALEPRTRILSGVQPSGKLHIGNYFGAIKQHVERQDRGECFYFIADYHALTSLKEAEEKEQTAAARNKQLKARTASQILADNVHDVALDYLALGLDPAKSHFFRQSDVPEVCELTWIFSSVTGMGLLERAHSYKDKVDRGIAPSVGLFTYPVLMAADILIYRSHLVPVGKDQEQHLEMSRDIAGAFNRAFGEVFPLPDAAFNEAAVVPGTDGQKMSKSYGNTIDIFAEGKALKTVVMSVVTDSTPVEAPKNPDTCNVFKLLKLFCTPDELGKVADLYRNPLLDAAQSRRAALWLRRRQDAVVREDRGLFRPRTRTTQTAGTQSRHRGGSFDRRRSTRSRHGANHFATRARESRHARQTSVLNLFKST